MSSLINEIIIRSIRAYKLVNHSIIYINLTVAQFPFNSTPSLKPGWCISLDDNSIKVPPRSYILSFSHSRYALFFNLPLWNWASLEMQR